MTLRFTEDLTLKQLEIAVESLRTENNNEAVDSIVSQIRGAFEDLSEPAGKESARILVRDIAPKINKLAKVANNQS